MNIFFRLLFGSVLVLTAIVCSVYVFGLIGVVAPLPITWWRSHAVAIIVGYQAVAFLPPALLLSLAFANLFLKRAFLAALVCAVLPVAVVIVPTFFAADTHDDSGMFDVMELPLAIAPFYLVIVPLMTYVASRLIRLQRRPMALQVTTSR